MRYAAGIPLCTQLTPDRATVFVLDTPQRLGFPRTVAMNLEAFCELLRANSADDLAKRFLQATSVAAFATSLDYEGFQKRVRERIHPVDGVAIVGSGNWHFSLNPDKLFRPFGSYSDIDVAIISHERYLALWEEMRSLHRRRFYYLSFEDKGKLRRNGENVYCGFISPTWIPFRNPAAKLEHKRTLNDLCDASVAYRPVRMMFFKNLVEAIDYYGRGFNIAKRRLL